MDSKSVRLSGGSWGRKTSKTKARKTSKTKARKTSKSKSKTAGRKTNSHKMSGGARRHKTAGHKKTSKNIRGSDRRSKLKQGRKRYQKGGDLVIKDLTIPDEYITSLHNLARGIVSGVDKANASKMAEAATVNNALTLRSNGIASALDNVNVEHFKTLYKLIPIRPRANDMSKGTRPGDLPPMVDRTKK